MFKKTNLEYKLPNNAAYIKEYLKLNSNGRGSYFSPILSIEEVAAHIIVEPEHGPALFKFWDDMAAEIGVAQSTPFVLNETQLNKLAEYLAKHCPIKPNVIQTINDIINRREAKSADIKSEKKGP
ncbi:MAG: hypothetical protein ACYCQI_04225 [Gammaproteobacteria bacterium]